MPSCRFLSSRPSKTMRWRAGSSSSPAVAARSGCRASAPPAGLRDGQAEDAELLHLLDQLVRVFVGMLQLPRKGWPHGFPRSACSTGRRGWCMTPGKILTDLVVGLMLGGCLAGTAVLRTPARAGRAGGYFSTPSAMPGALVEPVFITASFEDLIAPACDCDQAGPRYRTALHHVVRALIRPWSVQRYMFTNTEAAPVCEFLSGAPMTAVVPDSATEEPK